jgi:hypothetical protein
VAGRTTTAERIEAALHDERGLLEHRYRAMIGELGLGSGVAVQRRSRTNDRIRAAWHEGFRASYRIPTPWNGLSRTSPRAAALVAFLEFHDAAEFDPAITEADLAAHAQRALDTGRRRGSKASRPRTNTRVTDTG